MHLIMVHIILPNYTSLHRTLRNYSTVIRQLLTLFLAERAEDLATQQLALQGFGIPLGVYWSLELQRSHGGAVHPLEGHFVSLEELGPGLFEDSSTRGGRDEPSTDSSNRGTALAHIAGFCSRFIYRMVFPCLCTLLSRSS